MPDTATVRPASPVPGLVDAGGAASRALRIRLDHRATVVVVLAAPAAVEAAGAALAIVARDLGMGMHRAGPARWLLVGETDAAAVIAAVGEACGDNASPLDQSNGRVVFRVLGAPVREALAKGTAVDLHPLAFGPGSSAPTLFGHINVQLACLEPEIFEIVVMRSYARSLFDDLAAMCGEFGFVAEAA